MCLYKVFFVGGGGGGAAAWQPPSSPLGAPIYWPHQDLTQHGIRTSYVLETSKARKR